MTADNSFKQIIEILKSYGLSIENIASLDQAVLDELLFVDLELIFVIHLFGEM